MVDGFRRKALGVIGDDVLLDSCAVNFLFPCMGRVVLARGGRMLKFVQGLSEVDEHQDVAHTASVGTYNGEAAV